MLVATACSSIRSDKESSESPAAAIFTSCSKKGSPRGQRNRQAGTNTPEIAPYDIDRLLPSMKRTLGGHDGRREARAPQGARQTVLLSEWGSACRGSSQKIVLAAPRWIFTPQQQCTHYCNLKKSDLVAYISILLLWRDSPKAASFLGQVRGKKKALID